MAASLGRHADGTLNFDCLVLANAMPDGASVNRSRLREQLIELFRFDGDVMFYFSGHGYLSDTGGLICTADAQEHDWGIPMREIIELGLRSHAHQILMVLDCCASGALATANSGDSGSPLAVLRENMTVIAASRATEPAIEAGGHGLFTSAILDALDGGAADHIGFVTAPSLYMYASRRFTAWDQRPVYKTNATDVFLVRQCAPLIDRAQLRQLPRLFMTGDFKYQLDPEFEPEDEFGNVKEPVNQEKIQLARLFKSYRDAGLLKPSEPGSQLFWAARRSETVELTARGREYYWLVVNGKI